jgi:hypothetical protein
MRRITLCLFAAASLTLGQASLSQQKSAAGLISILAGPDRFNGKQVTVIGFLLLDHQRKHAASASLFLHEEDANNLLPNGIGVVPTEQMVREREKIDGMYVILTGTVRVVPAVGPDDARVIVIKDVQSYRVWSNPHRPLLKMNDEDEDAGKK